MTEYDEQAEKFLVDTITSFDIVYQFTGMYFEGDEEKRDVYRFTLKNARGGYSGSFGDSTHNTERRAAANGAAITLDRARKLGFKVTDGRLNTRDLVRAKNCKPSAYDVLACLEPSCPILFADFCADYGYDADSRAAEKTHRACLEQRAGLERIFTPEQLRALGEIA